MFTPAAIELNIPQFDIPGIDIFANGGACPALFKTIPATARVRPMPQLHQVNPMTGKLETWLHAGQPTAWSRVTVKKRRHHHHPR